MTRLAMMELSPDRRRPVGQKDITPVTSESVNQYATPRFSPDGLKIAVSLWQPGGNVDIWILDGREASLMSFPRPRHRRRACLEP